MLYNQTIKGKKTYEIEPDEQPVCNTHDWGTDGEPRCCDVDENKRSH